MKHADSHLKLIQDRLSLGEWFIVPHADAFQGEYTSPHDERLAWVSGFTGSAGTALINKEQAYIFADGRYTLQAKAQVDQSWTVIASTEQTAATFLTKALQPKSTLLLDPWLHTFQQYRDWNELCAKYQATLIACAQNPIDELWQNRPSASHEAIYEHPLAFAGETSESKRQQIIQELQDNECLLLTNCESIAWLLNIRGNDIPHTPIVHAYAILHKTGNVDLFINANKVAPAMGAYLGSGVKIFPLSAIKEHLCALNEQHRVWIDPRQTSAALALLVQESGAHLNLQRDPSVLKRARKNPTEIAGAVSAHIRDGVALTRFLAWVAENAPTGNLTEVSCAAKLLEFRRLGEHFMDISFGTISSVGSNGAIIHYQPTPQTDRRLEFPNLYLVDSGGQYRDGTTDVTRTIALGEPTAEQRRHFTLVLKGHIAIAAAQFPYGTQGVHLDALARYFLWQEGLNYAHGTGHGVGSYLCVHEGPQGISPKSHQDLLPGMILSNEPGYYQEGSHGIRIENLMVVEECQNNLPQGWLKFQTLTLAPLDRCLIETALLTTPERQWVDSYHQRVHDTLAPYLDEATRVWLRTATEALTL
ncbi:MAG: aminopeptidase P family protein [Alphaproteobacteria bacterium]